MPSSTRSKAASRSRAPRRGRRQGNQPDDPGAYGQRQPGLVAQQDGVTVRCTRSRSQATRSAHLGSTQPRKAPTVDDADAGGKRKITFVWLTLSELFRRGV